MSSENIEPDWRRWRRPLPARGQRRQDVWWGLVVLGAALFTLLIVNSMGFYAFGSAPSLLEQSSWAVAVTAPLVLRRRYPLAVLLVVAAVFIGAQARQIGDNLVPSVALFLALYSVGAWERNRVAARWSRVAVITGMFCWLGWSLIAFLVNPGEDVANAQGPLDPVLAAVLYNVVFNIVFFLSAYFFGDMAWLSARRQAELEYRAEELRRSERDNTRGAIMAERLRIARDLHDIVAHNVAVMGIQAGAARRVLDTDRELARTALDTVEQTARAAIGELRGLLGVLRADPNGDDPASDGPASADDAVHGGTTPLGMEQLPELVERARSTGLEVTFAVYGDEYPVPEGVAVSLYRVVQEALTNVVKHAAARMVDVRVRYLLTNVEVEITDDGRGSARAAERTTGLGLLGMRERVAVHGGVLETGARRSGGYRVRASFPRADTARTDRGRPDEQRQEERHP